MRLKKLTFRGTFRKWKRGKVGNVGTAPKGAWATRPRQCLSRSAHPTHEGESPTAVPKPQCLSDARGRVALPPLPNRRKKGAWATRPRQCLSAPARLIISYPVIEPACVACSFSKRSVTLSLTKQTLAEAPQGHNTPRGHSYGALRLGYVLHSCVAACFSRSSDCNLPLRLKRGLKHRATQIHRTLLTAEPRGAKLFTRQNPKKPASLRKRAL
jgi:hypothetical protein